MKKKKKNPSHLGYIQGQLKLSKEENKVILVLYNLQ